MSQISKSGGASGANVVGPGTSTSGDIAIFNNASGTLLADSGVSLTGTQPGQVLTYNGTIASLQNPNAYLSMYDDFLTENTISNYGWLITTGGTSSITPIASLDNGHPGVVQLSFSSVFANCRYFLNGLILGGGRVTLNWVTKFAQLSNGVDRFAALIGFENDNGEPITNGIYFRYSDNVNGGQWQCISVSASTPTVVNTATAADTNWHRYTIDVNAAASSITFSIDGTSVGTINTNIPTTAINPAILFFDQISSGATITMYVDLFYLYQSLTTPR